MGSYVKDVAQCGTLSVFKRTLAVVTCSSTVEAGRNCQASAASSFPSLRSESAQCPGSIIDPGLPCPVDTCLWHIRPVPGAGGALRVCGGTGPLSREPPAGPWPLSWALWSFCSRHPRSYGDTALPYLRGQKTRGYLAWRWVSQVMILTATVHQHLLCAGPSQGPQPAPHTPTLP